MPPGNLRDVLLTDLAEVVALWVTAQVIVKLVDEDRGQHAGVVSQWQAGRKVWNLPHHLQDLPQTYGVMAARVRFPRVSIPLKHVSSLVPINCDCRQYMASLEFRGLERGQEVLGFELTLNLWSKPPISWPIFLPYLNTTVVDLSSCVGSELSYI